MERFQGVIFKPEEKRFKNKKRARWKGKNFTVLLKQKPEKLNLLQYQLSKHFSKIFFGSIDMTKRGEKTPKNGVF